MQKSRLDGPDHDVDPKAKGAKVWVCEDKFVTIVDENGAGWSGDAADAFSAKVIEALTGFADLYEYKISRPDREAGAKQMVVLDGPPDVQQQTRPDPEVDQTLAETIAGLRAGQFGAIKNDLEFATICETKFNAIDGNRGKFFSHTLALGVFSNRKTSIRPTDGDSRIVPQSSTDIMFNSTQNTDGGGMAAVLAHEFVHVFGSLGAGVDEHARVVNAENMVRWENGLPLRKMYLTTPVVGKFKGVTLVLVEPVNKKI